jgi:hypothetical protein
LGSVPTTQLNCVATHRLPADTASIDYEIALYARTIELRVQRKKSPMRTIHTSLLLLALLVSGCSGGSSPTAPDSGGAWVEYHVTGTGTSRANLITYATANGGTAQAGPAALPWRFEWLAKAGDFLYVSAQNDSASGCIKVVILRRAVQFRQTESCGAFVIATASGTS